MGKCGLGGTGPGWSVSCLPTLSRRFAVPMCHSCVCFLRLPQIYYTTAPELRSPRSGCWQGCAPSGGAGKKVLL